VNQRDGSHVHEVIVQGDFGEPKRELAVFTTLAAQFAAGQPRLTGNGSGVKNSVMAIAEGNRAMISIHTFPQYGEAVLRIVSDTSDAFPDFDAAARKSFAAPTPAA
jgi:hypothetical protein